MELLHYFFLRLQLLTSILVVLSKNPIHSILFLVLLFIESTVTLILFKIEFIALLLIIVYVGAIAVLFLFVVIMLKLKIDAFIFSAVFPAVVGGLVVSFFWYRSLTALGVWSSADVSSEVDIFNPFIYENFDSFQDLDSLGQVVYNYYSVCFVVAGLVLLVALIGSIVLTLNFNKSRQNSVGFRRLSRSSSYISFFK